MQDLPLRSFDEIENIIDPKQESEDIYGLKNTAKGQKQGQVRRMADTYKRVREIA